MLDGVFIQPVWILYLPFAEGDWLLVEKYKQRGPSVSLSSSTIPQSATIISLELVGILKSLDISKYVRMSTFTGRII